MANCYDKRQSMKRWVIFRKTTKNLAHSVPPRGRIRRFNQRLVLAFTGPKGSKDVKRKTKRLQDRFALVNTVLTWVGRNFFPLSPRPTSNAIFGPFLCRLRWRVVNEGMPGSIAFIKHNRALFQKWLSILGSGSEEERGIRRKVRKVMGGPFVDKVQKFEGANPESWQFLRMALTVLTSLRSFRLPPEYDFEAIESVSTSVFTAPRLSIRRFLRRVGVCPFPDQNRTAVRWTKFHFTARSGPNGPALFTSHWDLLVVPEDLWESLYVVGGPFFREVVRHTKGLAPLLSDFLPTGPDQSVRVTNPRPDLSAFPWVTETPAPSGSRRSGSGNRAQVKEPEVVKTRGGASSIRRLVALSDLEGKTRNIAILDYWSQTVLRPIHFWIFEVLKKIPQDLTFSQGSFQERVQSWGSCELHSIDLTKATDRFPLSVISAVLKEIFGEEWVSHWEHIMVGYPFDVRNRKVSYQAGNPMGAYSSWSSFALAHHFVVYQSCLDVNTSWPDAKYVLLGDDILFGDPELAKAYSSNLVSLGVETSPLKTYQSKDFCEFAKRLLFRGQEITGFPVSSVVDNIRSIPLVVSALHGEEKKGLVPVSGIPDAILDLDQLRSAKWGTGRPNSRRIRTSLECDLVYRALRPDQGVEAMGDALRRLLYPYPFGKANPYLWESPDYVKAIWVGACNKLFHLSIRSPDYSKAGLSRSLIYNLRAKTFEMVRWKRVNPGKPGWFGPETDSSPPHLTVAAPHLRPGKPPQVSTIPVFGAVARLGYSFLDVLSNVEEGYGVDRSEWPNLVRSLGYSLPEFVNLRASEKQLRSAVMSRVGRALVLEAEQLSKDREEGLSVPLITLPAITGPQHPFDASWLHSFLIPFAGWEPDVSTLRRLWWQGKLPEQGDALDLGLRGVPRLTT